MKQYSTRQAAQKLGIGHSTLAHHVDQGKLPAPAHILTGRRKVHVWTDAEIEHVRQLLPKIANGRKTRYKKKQLAISNSQLAKKKSKTRSKKKK